MKGNCFSLPSLELNLGPGANEVFYFQRKQENSLVQSIKRVELEKGKKTWLPETDFGSLIVRYIQPPGTLFEVDPETIIWKKAVGSNIVLKFNFLNFQKDYFRNFMITNYRSNRSSLECIPRLPFLNGLLKSGICDKIEQIP